MSQAAESRSANGRNQTTRVAASRPDSWRPPQENIAPPCPEDMVQRWVRVGIRGADDQDNYLAKVREGWTPVHHSDLGYETAADCPWPVNSASGNIQRGSMLLMRMPQSFADQRNAHYRRQVAAQEAAMRSRFGKDLDGNGVEDVNKRTVKTGPGRKAENLFDA